MNQLIKNFSKLDIAPVFKKQTGGTISLLKPDALNTMTKMYNYMINDKKLSPELACAILGNVMQESAFNHKAISQANATGVYQLLGDKQKKYNEFLKTGWKDGPLSQTEFVLNEIFNGKDDYYDTYDTLKESQRNGWKRLGADGKTWVSEPTDSILFYNTFYKKEQNNTLPPRRTDVVNSFNNSRNINELTQLFMDYFERPSKRESHLEKRQQYAKEFYNYFMNKKKNGGIISYIEYLK